MCQSKVTVKFKELFSSDVCVFALNVGIFGKLKVSDNKHPMF